MRTILVDDRQVDIYNYRDFPYDKLRGSTVELKRKKYLTNIATFDIETTTIHQGKCNLFGGKAFGFMYVWQFCIDGFLCVGRTWEEYQDFIRTLKKWLGVGEYKLVVYVHNLQFEFQFMRNFFTIGKIFARGKRDIVTAEIEDLEYRCSYILSNMGLQKFLEKTEGVTFNKLDGSKYNYHIKRYPDTELTDMEMAYCVCDVLGLYEAIRTKLKDDTLATIPITSTGYVRRDYRDVLVTDRKYKEHMKNIALDEKTYNLCREASRGAIAGSNHMWTDETLEDVDSFDIKSSYPYQMATKYYPQSRFIEVTTDFGTDKMDTFLKNACCIIEWECEELKLKKWSAIPYISKAKCRAIDRDCRVGNGKVYYAKRIGMCCTEIDFRIICEDYTFENPKLKRLHVAHRDMLDPGFRKILLEMFQMKTDLEDGDKFLYDKYKNKINASFGMMLTDILHPEIIFKNNSEKPWMEEDISDINEALNKYYNSKTSFLSYQHGIWVLAHGRDDLHTGMKIVGADIVQVDTDSVKSLGNYRDKFNELNRSIIERAETFDIKPYAIKNGEKVYLGVWENEHHKKCKDKTLPTYKYFKTLGAKKYMVVFNKEGEDEFETTVSGLKKDAGNWFYTHGGMANFKSGTVVDSENSGRTASIYNDLTCPTTIYINGHAITMGSNIAIVDVPYTLGITGEWFEMILDKSDGSDIEIPDDNFAKGWF